MGKMAFTIPVSFMKLMALKYYDSVSDLKDAGRQTDRQTEEQ
jgi:hypothetical protein